MTEYRTLDQISIEYFSEHPEEIDDFINEIFAEYAKDGDSAALHMLKPKPVLDLAPNNNPSLISC